MAPFDQRHGMRCEGFERPRQLFLGSIMVAAQSGDLAQQTPPRGDVLGHTVLAGIIQLAVNAQNARIPGNNSFVSNDLDGFQSSLADIFVDMGVTNKSVIGRQARVEDHGNGTVVVPMR